MEGLGGTGSLSLGCVCPQGRIQSRIREGSPVDQGSQRDLSVSGSTQTGYPGGRGLCLDAQGSYRGSAGSYINGILFKDLSGNQEDRGLASHHRSKCSEHFSKVSNVQDGVSRVHQGFSSPGMVDVLNRSKRCLPTRANPSGSQEVSEVLLSRQNLPIQGSTIRSFPSSMALHQGGLRSESHDTWPRNATPSVPGRLAGESYHPRRMSETCNEGSSAGSSLRLGGQFREIGSHPQADIRFSGNPLQSGGLHSVSYRGEPYQAERQVIHVESRPTTYSQSVAATDWNDSLSRKVGEVWHAPYQTFSLASGEPLECPPGFPRYHDTNLRGNHGRSRLVVGGDSGSRRTSGEARSWSPHLHRRVHHRLGGPCEGYRGQGYLVTRRDSPPHKRARDEGCQTSPLKYVLETTPSCSSIHGQHLRGGIRKSARGYQVLVPLGGDNLTLQDVTREKGYLESCAHSRPPECYSRHVVEGGADSSNRMVSQSESGSSTVSRVGNTSGGPLCHQVQSQVPGVCLSSPRRSGLRDRCPLSGVEQSVGVCLPSSTNTQQGSTKGQNIEMQADPDCLGLGPTALLSRSVGAVSQAPVQVTPVARPSESTSVRSASPAARGVTTSRLASEHRALAEGGFSEEAANRITAPQAKSTLGIYEGIWKIFAAWCEERSLDPFQTSSPTIADFLLYLFKESKRRPSTIAGYRTAIAGALKISQGVDYGKDERLSNLILSFVREQPRQINSYPAWDLGLVMKVLLKAPFEPMQVADLKFVTWKTAFLMLLATGSRRGEVHALDYAKVHPGKKWVDVTLEPHVLHVQD